MNMKKNILEKKKTIEKEDGKCKHDNTNKW